MKTDQLDTPGTPGKAGAPIPQAAPGAQRLRGSITTVLVVIAVVGAAAWAYVANFRPDRPAMDMSMPMTLGPRPHPVVVVPAERAPIRGTVTYTGSVAAFNEEDVYPRVTGRIVEMPVYPGDRVARGQVVARLDDVELGSRVREAQAAAAAAAGNAAQMEAEALAARHGATQMERELAMTAAEVAAAREGITQAERDLAVMQAEAGYQESFSAREEQLHRSGAVSRQDVESARAAVASARAKVQAAEARVGQARATVLAGQAKLEAARARLDQARAMEAGALKKRDAMVAMSAQGQAMLQTAEVVRDYVNIRTPRAGHVVKRLVAPGVLVQPGTAILKIAEIDRVRLQANVGERHLASIRVGSPVRVSPSGAGQPPFTARVTSVFPFVDPGGRTAVVEAVVDNPGRRLVPGQYVTMELTTGEEPDAVAVPRGAVSRVGGRATVWVVKEDRVQPRSVTTGLEEPDRIEVREGLDAGEQVVVRGLEGLYAGAQVVAVAAGPAGGPAGGEAAAGSGASPGPARGAGAPGGGGGGHSSHAPKGGGHATH